MTSGFAGQRGSVLLVEPVRTRAVSSVERTLASTLVLGLPSVAVAAPDDRAYAGEQAIASPAIDTSEDDDELRATVASLQARVAELEARERERSRAKPPAPRRARLALLPGRMPLEVGFGPAVAAADYGLYLTGYVQAQYLHSQLSEDQLQQGGTPLNRDGFAIRRGRVRVGGDWRWVAFAFELDGSTTRGPFFGVRQAHVSALWRNPDATRPPYVMLTAGLTEVPFGYELRLGQREMPFMERSLGSLAMFTGPVDVGVRLRGGVGPFRYDVAVMNGSPLPDVSGSTIAFDPTRRPDVAGRLGFDVRPRRVAVSGGVSFLTGKGLHAGTDATKNRLVWNDLNENGTYDTGEIFSVPGTAALPSIGFSRWAFDADVQLGVRTAIGWTRVLAEVTIAQNLDRGVFVADPITAGATLRHLQAYAGAIQEITRWAMLGLRYDYYDYDADLLSHRRGRAVPADASIHTISPMVGAMLPAGVVPVVRGRLVVQYDVVLDALGRDSRGVPSNLKNDQVTVRAQVEF